MILTLVCEDSSRLVSDSLDRKLTWSEQLALTMHRMICWSCRRFHRQLAILREAARLHEKRLVDGQATADARLSPEARQRIKRVIERFTQDREL